MKTRIKKLGPTHKHILNLIVRDRNEEGWATVSGILYDELEKLPKKHEARKNMGLKVVRSELLIINLPPLNNITNRVGVMFNGENPKTAEIKE